MLGGDLVAPRGGGVVDGARLVLAVTLVAASFLLVSSSIGRVPPISSVPGGAPASNRGHVPAREKRKARGGNQWRMEKAPEGERSKGRASNRLGEVDPTAVMRVVDGLRFSRGENRTR